MKVELTVPTELKDITLQQYQKYLKIDAENDSDVFIRTKIIEIFCGIKGSLVLQMKAQDVIDITLRIQEMFKEDPSLVTTFKMNGKEYGFIPHLDEMSFGEYIDLDNYLGDWDSMHLAMNVLYRPVEHRLGKSYRIKDYEGGDGEHMKNAPMDAVMSAMVFFYNLGMDLSAAMMNSLKDKEMSLVNYLNSEASGDGISPFSPSLKEMLQDMKISLS